MKQHLADLVAAHGLHCEPVKHDADCRRLFIDIATQRDAYVQAFNLSDFAVSSVNGPFLFLIKR